MTLTVTDPGGEWDAPHAARDERRACVHLHLVAARVTAHGMDTRLPGMQLPNGVTTQYGYDAAGRLVELEHRDGDWLYYLPDAEGLVRQGTDDQGDLASAWLFDPDGALLERPCWPGELPRLRRGRWRGVVSSPLINVGKE